MLFVTEKRVRQIIRQELRLDRIRNAQVFQEIASHSSVVLRNRLKTMIPAYQDDRGII